LHKTVTREAADEKKPFELRPLSQNRVSVEAVDVIEPGPTANKLELFKSGGVLNELRPEDILKTVPVIIEIEPNLVVFERTSGKDKTPCFAAEEKTGRANDQGQRFSERDRRLKNENLALDRFNGKHDIYRLR
jgi:hypothetical protein